MYIRVSTLILAAEVFIMHIVGVISFSHCLYTLTLSPPSLHENILVDYLTKKSLATTYYVITKALMNIAVNFGCQATNQ